MGIKISINLLHPSSIQSAIDAIEEYKERVDAKTSESLEVLTDDVYQGVVKGFGSAGYNDVITDNRGFSHPTVPVSIEKGEKSNRIVASGKDAVFMEFGAGVHYNEPDFYPDRPSWIEKIGEYGHGYGKQDTWRYYDKSVGKWVETYGTPASMPMYMSLNFEKMKAAEIIRNIFNKS